MGCVRGFERQPFFHQQVGVDAAKAEGAHRSAARHAVGAARPGGRGCQHLKRALLQVETGRSLLEIGGRRQSLLGQGQQHLGQGCGAGSGERVPDIRFHRADHATLRPLCRQVGALQRTAPELLQAGHLGGVAYRSAGRVALDQVHVLRSPAGLGISGAHGAQLPVGQRRQQASPHVVGKPDALDHPVDAVAVGEGVLGPLQQENPGAFSDHQTVPGRVERRADAAP